MGIVTAATHPFCSMQSDLFYEFNQFENSFFFLFGRRSYTHIYIYIYFQDVEKMEQRQQQRWEMEIRCEKVIWKLHAIRFVWTRRGVQIEWNIWGVFRLKGHSVNFVSMVWGNSKANGIKLQFSTTKHFTQNALMNLNENTNDRYECTSEIHRFAPVLFIHTPPRRRRRRRHHAPFSLFNTIYTLCLYPYSDSHKGAEYRDL